MSRWGSAPKKECCCSAVAVFCDTFAMAADALLLFDLVRPKRTLGTFLLCVAGFVLCFRPLYMAIGCNEILWFAVFCKTFPAWWVLRRYRPWKPLLAATHSTSFENSHSTNSRWVSVIASISWILEHIEPAATDGLWDDGNSRCFKVAECINTARGLDIKRFPWQEFHGPTKIIGSR